NKFFPFFPICSAETNLSLKPATPHPASQSQISNFKSQIAAQGAIATQRKRPDSRARSALECGRAAQRSYRFPFTARRFQLHTPVRRLFTFCSPLFTIGHLKFFFPAAKKSAKVDSHPYSESYPL